MYTVFDEQTGKFSKVEEPDPSITYTYADYLKWRFEEQLELIQGRIFKMSPAPSPFHQEICSNLNREFSIYLQKKKCKVYPAPFDVRFPGKKYTKDSDITTVVQPDLSIVCDLSKIDERGCVGAPDLIVEVLSGGNSKKEIKLKYELYQEAGVKEYWIVYPAEQSVAVFLLNKKGAYKGATLYAGNDKIQSKAISGLTVELIDIFTK